MNAINFKESNHMYGAEGCLDLPVYKDEERMVSCWMPDDEEMEYIKYCIENNEIPVFHLSIYGNVHPPVYVSTPIYVKAGELQ